MTEYVQCSAHKTVELHLMWQVGGIWPLELNVESSVLNDKNWALAFNKVQELVLDNFRFEYVLNLVMFTCLAAN